MIGGYMSCISNSQSERYTDWKYNNNDGGRHCIQYKVSFIHYLRLLNQNLNANRKYYKKILACAYGQ